MESAANLLPFIRAGARPAAGQLGELEATACDDAHELVREFWRLAEPDAHHSRGATWRGMTDGGAQERDLAQYYRKCSEETGIEWLRTSALLEQIAKSYEHEGVAHDDDAERRDW